MTDPNTDSVLNDYLQGDSGLSRSYQMSSVPGPSPTLDAQIMLAAKQHLGNRQRKAFGPIWLIPSALAALLLVVFSLVLWTDIETIQPEQAPPIILSESWQPSDSQSANEPLLAKNEPDSKLQSRQPAAERSRVATEPKTPIDTPSVPLATLPASPVSQETQSRPSPEYQRQLDAAAKPLSPAQATSEKPAAVASSPPAPVPRQPDEWLKQLDEQLKAGKREVVRDELVAFRRAYPHHVIDEKRFAGLIELLKEIKEIEPPATTPPAP